MTETRLREALRAAAEGVPRPELAQEAWAAARRYRTRRARWVAGGLGVTAVTALALVITAVDGTPDRATGPFLQAPATSQPARSGGPSTGAAGTTPPTVFQPGPTVAEESKLPVLDTRLRGLDLRKRPATALSPAHTGHIVAAYLVGGGPYTAALLLDSGEEVRLDMALQVNSDPGGNPQTVLDARAISPDRSEVVFLQNNGVVVADAVAGSVKRWTSPGAFYGAAWLPSGGLVLTKSPGNLLFDVRTGKVASTPVKGELVAGGTTRSITAYPMQLRNEPASPAGSVALDPGVVGSLWQAAFARGTQVAMGVFTAAVQVSGVNVSNPQGVAVIDASTGAAARLLVIDFDKGHSKGCCSVLGWLDDDTVLYRNSDRWVLAWNVRTGGLGRVVDRPSFALALGDIRSLP